MFNKIFHTYIKKYLNIPLYTHTVESDGYIVRFNDEEIPVEQVQKERPLSILKEENFRRAPLYTTLK